MKTIQNLTEAFVGESCARNFYDFAAKIAYKEGFLRAGKNFETTALQENQHAKWLLKMIAQLGGAQKISLEKVAHSLGNTQENLKNAIEGEKFEYEKMYPQFAEIAKNEGHPEIAQRILAISKAEENHQRRFSEILQKIEQGEKGTSWECQKCGFWQEGENPPEKCPSCDHPQNYFFAF